ncbi:hypothetical protein RSOLAG1IB_09040 [Rhizoctonia solani AG-1 IB]|uniref:Uncharacterized protein n=1 Tax=Thanatephorus cucumeris (strain AG1-IB / isolate 7/3/14) TaxID=1108050 RepID=A0A0B7FS59_THACB|nr:hypothetical protein RSOLAG1IB_09040 [Rhizoctonia solani AG-1 IB]
MFGLGFHSTVLQMNHSAEHTTGHAQVRRPCRLRLQPRHVHQQTHMHRGHAHQNPGRPCQMGKRRRRSWGVLGERHGRHGQDHDRIHLLGPAQGPKPSGGQLLLYADFAGMPGRDMDHTDDCMADSAVVELVPASSVRRHRERAKWAVKDDSNAGRAPPRGTLTEHGRRNAEESGGGDRCAGRMQ